jgi:hypothetical protein
MTLRWRCGVGVVGLLLLPMLALADLAPRTAREHCAAYCGSPEVRAWMATVRVEGDAHDRRLIGTADSEGSCWCYLDGRAVAEVVDRCRRGARWDAAAVSDRLTKDCTDEYEKARCVASTAAEIAACFLGVKARHERCRADAEAVRRRLYHANVKRCWNAHPNRTTVNR